jgi:hypothetical protein
MDSPAAQDLRQFLNGDRFGCVMADPPELCQYRKGPRDE